MRDTARRRLAARRRRLAARRRWSCAARDGHPFDVELLTVGSGDNVAEQLIQSDLAARGIDGERASDGDGRLPHHGARHRQAFDLLIAGIPGDLSFSYVSALFDSAQRGGTLDYTGFHTPALDDLLASRSAAPAGERSASPRGATCSAALDSLAPATWLYHSRGVQGVSRRVRGVRMDLRGELVHAARLVARAARSERSESARSTRGADRARARSRRAEQLAPLAEGLRAELAPLLDGRREVPREKALLVAHRRPLPASTARCSPSIRSIRAIAARECGARVRRRAARPLPALLVPALARRARAARRAARRPARRRALPARRDRRCSTRYADAVPRAIRTRDNVLGPVAPVLQHVSRVDLAAPAHASRSTCSRPMRRRRAARRSARVCATGSSRRARRSSRRTTRGCRTARSGTTRRSWRPARCSTIACMVERAIAGRSRAARASRAARCSPTEAGTRARTITSSRIAGSGTASRSAARPGIRSLPTLVARFDDGFAAPFRTVLPDLTFPSRRDSQYAVSVRQPRFAESCELGLARARRRASHRDARAAVRSVRSARRDRTRAHPSADVERNLPGDRAVARRSLLALAALRARRAAARSSPQPLRSDLLPAQGFGILRRDEGALYVALDYGHSGGGHGHPDRLNLLAHGRRRRAGSTIRAPARTSIRRCTGIAARSRTTRRSSTVARSRACTASCSRSRTTSATGWVSAQRRARARPDRAPHGRRWWATISSTSWSGRATSAHDDRDLPMHGVDARGAMAAHDASRPRRSPAATGRGGWLRLPRATRSPARLPRPTRADARAARGRSRQPAAAGSSLRGAGTGMVERDRARRCRGATVAAAHAPARARGRAALIVACGAGASGSRSASSAMATCVVVLATTATRTRTSPCGAGMAHRDRRRAGDARVVELGGRVRTLSRRSLGDHADAVARRRRPAPIPTPVRSSRLGEPHYRRSELTWDEAGAPAADRDRHATDRRHASSSTSTCRASQRLLRRRSMTENPLDNEPAAINGDGVQLYVRRGRAQRRAGCSCPSRHRSRRPARRRRLDERRSPSTRSWRPTASGYRLDATRRRCRATRPRSRST